MKRPSLRVSVGLAWSRALKSRMAVLPSGGRMLGNIERSRGPNALEWPQNNEMQLTRSARTNGRRGPCS